MNSITTDFVFDDGEFFAAHNSIGGARVGMNSAVALDVGANHELRAEILALDSADAIEAFIDSQVEAGRIPLSAFNRI